MNVYYTQWACYTIGETDLEVANVFANFEASGKHFVEATDQRVAGRQDYHLPAKRGHPRLKHLPWSNGKQGPKRVKIIINYQ